MVYSANYTIPLGGQGLNNCNPNCPTKNKVCSFCYPLSKKGTKLQIKTSPANSIKHMATLMAGGSNPYIGLGLDESGNWIPGTPRVLSLLSSVLERSIRGNEKLLAGLKIKDGITPFHGTKQPSLDVRQYVERIFRYCKCSNSCFVVAIIYIDRFLQRIDAYLTSLNVHRLLITTVLVAAKFMDDQCYNNAYYAKVGGVSTEELNRLEMKLLFDLDFQLHVTTEVFNKYWLKIQQEGDAAGTARASRRQS